MNNKMKKGSKGGEKVGSSSRSIKKSEETDYSGTKVLPHDSRSKQRLAEYLICLVEDEGKPCMVVHKDSKKMSRHREKVHRQPVYKCTKCIITFTGRNAYDRHFKDASSCTKKDHSAVEERMQIALKFKNDTVESYFKKKKKKAVGSGLSSVGRKAISPTSPVLARRGNPVGSGSVGRLTTTSHLLDGSGTPVVSGSVGRLTTAPTSHLLAAEATNDVSGGPNQELEDKIRMINQLAQEALIETQNQSEQRSKNEESVLQQSTKERDELVLELERLREEYARVNKELGELSNVREAFQRAEEEKASIQNQYGAKNGELQLKISNLTDQLNDCESALSVMEARVKEVVEEKKNAVEQVEQQLVVKNEEVMRLEEGLRREKMKGGQVEEQLKTQLEQLNESFLQLQGKYDDIHQKYTRLSEEYGQKCGLIQQQEQSKERPKMMDLTSENEGLKEKLQICQSDLEAKQKAITEMKLVSFEDLVSSFKTMQLSTKTYLKQVQHLQEENAALKNQRKGKTLDDVSGEKRVLVESMISYIEIMESTKLGYEAFRTTLESRVDDVPRTRFVQPSSGQRQVMESWNMEEKAALLSFLNGYYGPKPKNSNNVDGTPRPCFIDGLNLTHKFKTDVIQHRKQAQQHKYAEYEALDVVVNLFKSKYSIPESMITIIMPYYAVYDKDGWFLTKFIRLLFNRGLLVVVPSRSMDPYSNVKDDYDDILLLNFARNCCGFVVSNDNFVDILDPSGIWQATKFTFLATRRTLKFVFERDGKVTVLPGNKLLDINAEQICRFCRESNEGYEPPETRKNKHKKSHISSNL